MPAKLAVTTGCWQRKKACSSSNLVMVPVRQCRAGVRDLREKLRALLALQKVDSRIDELTALVARLNDDPELAALRADLASKTEQADTLERREREITRQIRWNDGEVRGLKANVQTHERKLYGGTIGNPKELSQLQAKIEEIKQAIGKLEDQTLNLMVEAEELEPKLAEAKGAGAAAAEAVAMREAAAANDLATANAELAGLPAHRRQVVATVDPKLLPDYDYVRSRRAGAAVVVIDRGVCPACRMAVPPMLQSRIREGTTVVKCENCGRFLCWPE